MNKPARFARVNPKNWKVFKKSECGEECQAKKVSQPSRFSKLNPRNWFNKKPANETEEEDGEPKMSRFARLNPKNWKVFAKKCKNGDEEC